MIPVLFTFLVPTKQATKKRGRHGLTDRMADGYFFEKYRYWLQFQIIWSCQGVGNVLGFGRDKQMRYSFASTPRSVALSPRLMKR